MTRVLWFHPRPWGPAQGGGDLRTWGLLAGAAARGHEILLVVPAGDDAPPPFAGGTLLTFRQPVGPRLAAAKAFSRHPLRSPRIGRRERPRVVSEIAEFEPEVAVVSEVMAWPIASGLLPGGVPVVYDCANLESDLFRALREDAAALGDKVTFAVDARRVARGEKELLRRASAVLAVSELDASALAPRVGPGIVSVVPSSVPDPGRIARPADNAPVVLFVGTLDYSPNTLAIEELMGAVLPLIRERVPDARLQIVGRRAPTSMRRHAEQLDWVDLVEDVPDLGPHYLDARCVVTPIRSGGGTKLKVYEALAYGAPLVATAEAAAGIPLQDGTEVLIGDSVESLADRAVRVLTDARLASSLGAAGRLAFTQRLSWDSGPVQRLDEVLRKVAG
jgi:glycosyltransferase involved in cell wall biosynthesis